MKQVSLEELQIGMFVTGLDRSWFRSPFLRHRFLITSQEEIEALRRAGIGRVTIDPFRGADLPAQTSGAVPPRQEATVWIVERSSSQAVQTLEQELAVAKQARDQMTRTVSRVFDHMKSSGTIHPSDVADALKEITIVTRSLTDAAVFMVMSQGRHTDPALSTHALVTCTLSLILGQGADLSMAQLQDLAAGALLHDIGLIGLPPSLLSRLNNTSVILARKDRAVYEEHPRLAAIRLEQRQGFHQAVREIVAEHHALLNGKGFPSETNPATIGRLSRIVMIADRYDDLLTGFGGATPLQPHDAIQRLFLESKEHALDPELTAVFIKRVGVFPVYSTVELSTGERAIVTELNPESLHLPVVHLTHTAGGHTLPSPTRVDLSKQDKGQPVRSVSRVIDSRGFDAQKKK